MEEQDNKNNEKIQSLREMIYNAEKTLQGAKAMLLQLEGKKKVGRRKKTAEEDSEDGRVIEGTFDGQIMIGADGKQYPVPANYASKSKLVEGDMLKLTITPEGSFIYKQIGPVERKRVIGVVSQDADENYFVAADGQAFRVLLASITYFKVEPGDEVTLVIPRDIDSEWGSIENVLQKSRDAATENHLDFLKEESRTKKTRTKKADPLEDLANEDTAEENIEVSKSGGFATDPESPKEKNDASIIDEWTPDLEELKKELNGE